MSAGTGESAGSSGLVLLAYDGCELAAFAMEEAGRQLGPGRDAIVVCVWQPVDVGFHPLEDRHLDATNAQEVRAAAEEMAAHGVSLAEQAGFRARPAAVEATPIWQGLIDTAQERDASLIVLGSHRHSGIERLLGSVASAVIKHSDRSVLLVRRHS
jgi:nucleotide-binding universal stress UspA family protein